MSVDAMTAVWRYSQAPDSTSLFILIAMADWADAEGYCFPSYRAIAEKTGVSVATVKRALRHHTHHTKEIELVTTKGHTRPTPREFVGRTGFQATNLYRITLVDKLGSPRPQLLERNRVSVTPLRAGRSGHPDPEGRVRDDAKVGSSTTEPLYTYQKDTQEDTSAGPPLPSTVAAAFDAADPIDQFCLDWNTLTTAPLKHVASLTADRRRHIRACLTWRTREVWRDILARVNRSGFCRGEGPRGWVASFDWLISSTDVAIKVLEGQYDDSFSEAELRAAADARFRATGGRCSHPTTCECLEDCVEKWAKRLREQRRVAS